MAFPRYTPEQYYSLPKKDRVRVNVTTRHGWSRGTQAIKLALYLAEFKRVNDCTIEDLSKEGIRYLKERDNKKYAYCHLTITPRRVAYLLELHVKDDIKVMKEIRAHLKSTAVSTARTMNNFSMIMNLNSEEFVEYCMNKERLSEDEFKLVINGLHKCGETLKNLPQISHAFEGHREYVDQYREQLAAKVMSDDVSMSRYKEITNFFLKDKKKK